MTYKTEALSEMLLFAERLHRIRSLPDDSRLHCDEFQAAIDEQIAHIKKHLEPSPGEHVARMVDLAFKTLNHDLPDAEVLATYYHLLAEIPQDILTQATRLMLRSLYARPAPADWFREAGPLIAARRSDLWKVSFIKWTLNPANQYKRCSWFNDELPDFSVLKPAKSIAPPAPMLQ